MKPTDATTHSAGEDDRVRASHRLLDLAIAKYKPVAVLGLFSGGHDSLTAVHVASRHSAFTAAVHLNTGIGLEETRQFVRETSSEQGWDLREYRAKEDCGQDYKKIVEQYGFPGPASHSTMYIRLKERPLRLCMRLAKAGHKRRDTVILVSGVRFQESERRMGYEEAITKEDSKIWVNIINDWSKVDCNRYLSAHEIRRSPVVDKIHKSGECLCGAYAKLGELDELELWFPEKAAEIKAMKSKNCKPWGWGSDSRPGA